MVKSEDSIDWEPETLRALPLAMFRDNYRRAETKVSQKQRCQEPFPSSIGDFRGRPRGVRVLSRPSRSATAVVQLVSPYGLPR